MRVTSNNAKATILVVGVIVSMAAILLVGVGLGPAAGYAAALAFTVALVMVPARCFRGPGEPVDVPRPWWRATNRPLAGYVVGALYLIQAGTLFSRLGAENLGSVGVLFATVQLALGAYLVHSSVRLVRDRPADGPSRGV